MNRLWLGEEVEGQYKGMLTLFVGDDSLSSKDILEYARKYKVKQIYFGAGGCRDINIQAMHNCVEEGFIITAEVTMTVYKNMTLHNSINYIVTTKLRELYPNVSLKLQDRSKLYVFSTPIVTSLESCNGEMYSHDKVLL